MRRLRLWAAFIVGLVTVVTATAVETSFWQVATFEEFLQGRLSGVSLSKEGRLRLGPEFQTVLTPEEPLALSLAADPHRNVYVGTGHQGKVFRLDADMKASLFFKAEEPDIFALAVGPDGALYVGSSPEGKVYRVAPDGKAETFYEPKVKYVWALAFDQRGNLYVGTGDKGQILRIGADRKAELFFDSKQTHIMCLAFDRERNLLAGSVPNGLIYRITPQGKAFVLYQAGLPEVRELALDNSGNIYAAALGSVTGKGTPDLFQPQPPGAQMPAAVTTVTVTASSGGGDSAAEVQQAPPQQPSGLVTGRPGPAGVAFPTLQIPQGRGALIRILPDYTAETIWSSNSDSLFALVVREQHVLFSTDTNGRVFDLDLSDSRQKLTLLSETQESVATRLLLQGPSLFIATSSAAKLFHAGSGATREGTYESPVKDTKVISRWGVVSWRGEVPPGTKVELFTRSGNSERPDKTWTEWVGPYTNSAGSPILSTPARFIQWKAVLRGNGEATPALDEVSISYLNQNLPPQVRSVSISTASERTSPGGTGSGTPSASSGLVGASGTPTTSFGSGMGGAGMGKTPLVVSWQADDPNGDQLSYSLYVKATDEQEWHLLKDKVRQSAFTIEPNTLADGKYVAKLVASDELSNPTGLLRTAELDSAPFWIDNTPPRVTVLRQVAASGQIKIQFQAEDNASPVRAAEIAIDNKEWKTVHADDGVADSLTETFTAKAEGLDPGEHLFALRAIDSAGNVGVGKAVVQVAVQRGRTR